MLESRIIQMKNPVAQFENVMNVVKIDKKKCGNKAISNWGENVNSPEIK